MLTPEYASDSRRVGRTLGSGLRGDPGEAGVPPDAGTGSCGETTERTYVTHPDDDFVVPPVFEELGRVVVAEQSLDAVLQTVAVLAGQILPGEPVVSVTVVDPDRPSTVASSGDLAVRLDAVQYRLGDGPCLSAATTGRRSAIVDTRRADAWPEFAGEAAAAGVGSVLSFPLPMRGKARGALNVYDADVAVDERRHTLVSRLADHAVVPVANTFLYESAAERAEHLAAALESRAVIDQAKGILMERFKLTADQAFQALARVSMRTNTKVRDIAERLVRTGELSGS
jgi:GAF domain-containing protein